jgi:hypothetical protein
LTLTCPRNPYTLQDNEHRADDRNDDHDRKAVRLDRVAAHQTRKTRSAPADGRIFLILHPSPRYRRGADMRHRDDAKEQRP